MRSTESSLPGELTVEGHITTLVADAQPLYLDGLARAVRQDARFQVVGAVGDGECALAEIARLGPRVAVVDAELPSLPGVRIVRAVARERLPTRVILLGAAPTPASVYAALADGAAGCLTKGASADELRQAVAGAARGDVVLGAGVPAALAQEIVLRGDAGRPALSPREREILRHLAEGHSAPRIAREIHLARTTVATHVAHIYEKLGVNDRAAAVATAMRRGLLD